VLSGGRRTRADSIFPGHVRLQVGHALTTFTSAAHRSRLQFSYIAESGRLAQGLGRSWDHSRKVGISVPIAHNECFLPAPKLQRAAAAGSLPVGAIVFP